MKLLDRISAPDRQTLATETGWLSLGAALGFALALLWPSSWKQSKH